MASLSNLLTPYDAIYMVVNIVAPRFLKDVKNLKFVYTDSGPVTMYCVGRFCWSFHGKRSAVKSSNNMLLLSYLAGVLEIHHCQQEVKLMGRANSKS